MADETSDVLSFFGSSPTRLPVLDALRGGATSMAELADRFEVSRITLWRALGDLQDRGWVRETDGGYEATVAGRLIVDRIASMTDAVVAIEKLDDLLEWLPLDEMDFEIERLADADVVRPTPSDPQAPMRLATRQIREASTIRILTHGFSPWVIESMHERGLGGEQSAVLVTATDVLEAFDAEPALGEMLRELLEAGRLEYFHCRDEVPHIFAILDGDHVGIGVDDDDGRPRAAFDVHDPTVVDWAERTFERYRSQSSRVEPARFNP